MSPINVGLPSLFFERSEYKTYLPLGGFGFYDSGGVNILLDSTTLWQPEIWISDTVRPLYPSQLLWAVSQTNNGLFQ